MNNKRIWEDWEIDFIKSNFDKLSSKQMADHLGVKLCSFRMMCYKLGLKRMELEYWTKAQINFLVKNYRKLGDRELAEVFNKRWKKDKGWSHKHIEKKRKYMNLKRTAAEIKAIHKRNVTAGRFAMCPVKAWKTRGVFPDGTIRYWKPAHTQRRYPVIKVNGRYINWARWAWEKHYGAVPKGMNVVFKDGNTENLQLSNLELLTDGQLARRNGTISIKGLSDNYVAGVLTHNDRETRQKVRGLPKLIELKRNQILLNRQIKWTQNNYSGN